MKVLFTSLMLFFVISLTAQSSTTHCITLMNEIDNKPIVNAEVKVVGTSKISTTDDKGYVCIEMMNNVEVVDIMHSTIGFIQRKINRLENTVLYIQKQPEEIEEVVHEDAEIFSILESKSRSDSDVKVTSSPPPPPPPLAPVSGVTTDEISSYSYEAEPIKTESVTLSEVAVTAKKPRLISKASTKAVSMVSSITKKDRREKKSRKSKADKAPKVKEVYDALSMDDSFTEGEFIDAKEEKNKGVPVKNSIKAGQLTAGEIHDFSKWEMWNDLRKEDLKTYQNAWGIIPQQRYAFQLSSSEGFPVVDATIELKQNNRIIYTAKSDNTGKAELWFGLFDDSPKKNTTLSATVRYEGQTISLEDVTEFSDGINHIEVVADCAYPKNVDIAFVVDATGSMGDEIDYLKVELLDVIDRVKKEHNQVELRLGNVFYRDKTDDYLTKKSALNKNINTGVDFIKLQDAAGGGDYPEAVHSGLEVAIEELDWSENALSRIIFLVLDAPPHTSPEVLTQLKKYTKLAAEKGIRIVPVTGSGLDKSTEYLMRSIALATNGNYLFLTDDSGIGGSHIAPSTDEYETKYLNNLMVELINNYLTVPDCNNQWTKIIEPDEKEEIKIYPNPNDGMFNIKTNVQLNEVFITDANGKIVVHLDELDKGDHPVEMGQFPNGMYLLRYQYKEKVQTSKIVIKHY